VDIYNDLKGNIFVDLSFRKPIIRIMSVYNENYYIDEKGKKMGISPKFSPKVPVATGHTYSTSTYPDMIKTFELATFISNDKFLFSLTGQIYVDFNKEITIIPRIGNFEILLGKIENLVRKFRKQKIFYEKIIPAEGWKNYKKVDLRFEKQIVVN
jgi:cell division protein FtsQ